MKTRIAFILLIQLFAFLLAAQGESPLQTYPSKPWRVALYQGGEYKDYFENLLGIIQGLKEFGWITYDELPEELVDEENRGVWLWLNDQVSNKRIEFVKDAFWDANWDNAKRALLRDEIIDRLNAEDSGIDMVFAAGTWAGQDLVNDRHHTPVIVFSTSDPVMSKIIPAYDDNGFPHTFVASFPYRYEMQLQTFFDVIGFKKLGVVYEDTPTGRSYAALETVHKMSKLFGFEVVEEHCVQDRPDRDETLRDLIAAHKRLAPQVDAAYLTEYETMLPENMPALLEPFFNYNVPTFSQSGIEDVPYGVLMSLETERPDIVGLFIAKAIGRIINGAVPGEQENQFQSPPMLSINLETARRIGLDVPINVLEMADNIYKEIQIAEPEQD